MKKSINNSKPFAVFVTDVHLDRGNTGLVKDIFDQLISLCLERGVSNIICGGDVFTTRSGQPLECLSAWQEILGKLRDKSIVIDVIPGNHDKTDGNDECSYLDVYAGGSRYFRLHRVGSTEYFCNNSVRVDFIPYFGTERWMEEFEIGEGREFEDNELELKVLVTHMAFNGVRNADGSEVSDGIAPAVVKDYDVVICGHYHDRSVVGRNIHYVGSAYQNNYGEGIVDKGFAVLYEDGSIEYVQSRFPRYIKETLQATDRETLTNLLEKYGDKEGRFDNVRFEFVGSKADLERLDVTELQTRYGIDCKFNSVEEREAVESAVGEDVLNYDVSSVTKNFYRFCAENNIRGAELKYGVGLIKILKCGVR